MPNPTTIGTWLAWAKTQIAPIDAEIIATYNFAPEGADRSWLVAHSEEPLPTDFTNPFNLANDMISERRKGVPIAYLIGRRQFYGRDFDLTRDVLIPRVESEAIIDLAKALDLPVHPASSMSAPALAALPSLSLSNSPKPRFLPPTSPLRHSSSPNTTISATKDASNLPAIIYSPTLTPLNMATSTLS